MTPEVPLRTRASRLSTERRQEIFEAVVELVQAQGYEATTIEQVAAAARTSKATLYRHWSDKPSLVVAAVTGTSAIDLAAIDTGSLVTDLELLVDMMAARAQRNLRLALTLAEASQHDHDLAAAYRRALEPELAVLHAVGEHAVARGEVPEPARVAHLRDLVVGGLFGSVVFGGPVEDVDREHLRRHLHAVVVPFLTGTGTG